MKCLTTAVSIDAVQSAALGLDEVDEEVGGGVVGGDGGVVLHLGLDGLGQLLAQLHTAKGRKREVTQIAILNRFD